MLSYSIKYCVPPKAMQPAVLQRKHTVPQLAALERRQPLWREDTQQQE